VGTQAVGEAIERAGRAVERFGQRLAGIAEASHSIDGGCSTLVKRAGELTGELATCQENFEAARSRMAELSSASESMARLAGPRS